METQITVRIPCRLCGEVQQMPVTEEQIRNWQNGMVIQKAMPHLSDAQREMFITATCGSCWDKIFPPEEDE